MPLKSTVTHGLGLGNTIRTLALKVAACPVPDKGTLRDGLGLVRAHKSMRFYNRLTPRPKSPYPIFLRRAACAPGHDGSSTVIWAS